MMNGDNSTEGLALGDITNRPGKRGRLLSSGNSSIKPGYGNGENVNDIEGASRFAQIVCLGVENIVKEKCRTSFVVNDNDKAKGACVSLRPCSEINSLRGNVVSSISKIPCEVKESNSFGGSLHCSKSDTSIGNVVEVGDASRDSCVSSVSIPTGFGSCAGQSCGDPLGEQLAAHVCKTDVMDQGVSDLVSTKHRSVGDSSFPKSQNSKSFELERCIGLKGDGSSNSSVGADSIKACSCSFCTKASYIWADLLYQDVKGRMAALKKSQKDASILVQKSCSDKGIDKHGQGNSNKSSKLESELMGQWRSLFLRMEGILVHESNQLEASLFPLKDLRENCKTELEMIKGMPSKKQ